MNKLNSVEDRRDLFPLYVSSRSDSNGTKRTLFRSRRHCRELVEGIVRRAATALNAMNEQDECFERALKVDYLGTARVREVVPIWRLCLNG